MGYLYQSEYQPLNPRLTCGLGEGGGGGGGSSSSSINDPDQCFY